MSFENRSSTTPPAPPLYTIYPAGNQGNINYGFQGFRPEDPPPKYEDVISGEHLKSNYSSYNYSPSPTAAPAYQSINMNAHCTCPRLHTAQSEHSFDENEKITRCSAVCTVLVVFVIFVLIVLRITLLFKG